MDTSPLPQFRHIIYPHRPRGALPQTRLEACLINYQPSSGTKSMTQVMPVKGKSSHHVKLSGLGLWRTVVLTGLHLWRDDRQFGSCMEAARGQYLAWFNGQLQYFFKFTTRWPPRARFRRMSREDFHCRWVNGIFQYPDGAKEIVLSNHAAIMQQSRSIKVSLIFQLELWERIGGKLIRLRVFVPRYCSDMRQK